MTRELLSEVLNINDIKEYECRDNECHIVRHDLPLPMGNQHILINIYELAHKCKKWAHNKNYWLSTCYTGQVKIYDAGSTYPKIILHTEITESEAIFKACEWILEQKEIEL